MLFTHCQKRDFGAKNRSVLSKILIGFSGNPLELGEIGGDSRTQIFTVFSMQRGAESLENTAFSGLSHLPLSSVKFRQVRFWQLDSKSVCGQPHVSSNLTVCAIMWRQKRCPLRKARLYRAFLLPKRRFFSVPKRRCKIAVFPLWIDLNSRKVNIRYARQIEIKNLSAFSITLKRRNQICYRKN